MWKRRKIRTERLRKKRRQEIIDESQRNLALIGALVILFSQISMLVFLRVDRVVVRGNEFVDVHEVSDIVLEEVSGYYYNLFSKRNVLLFPRFSIRDRMYAGIPRINNLDIDIENLNIISINIEEREVYALFCEGTDGGCYFVDPAGFVFAAAPRVPGSKLFVYEGDVLSKPDEPIRSTILGVEEVSLVNAFRDAVEKLMSVNVVRLNAENETEYRYEISGGAEIIVDPRGGVPAYEEALSNLDAIVSSSEFIDEVGDDYSRLDYLDVRYGKKAFYRLESRE